MVGPWIHYLEEIGTKNIFSPGLVWSDKTGKVFDVKEETC